MIFMEGSFKLCSLTSRIGLLTLIRHSFTAFFLSMKIRIRGKLDCTQCRLCCACCQSGLYACAEFYSLRTSPFYSPAPIAFHRVPFF